MVSKNGETIIKYLLKHGSERATINQISKQLDISVGSAHKILKEFEREGIVASEPIGNSIIYSLNQHNPATRSILLTLERSHLLKIKKKTKIICTIGPATASTDLIKELISEGMDVVRINGSHGTNESNLHIINCVRSVDATVPILLDLPGKKIRLGDLKEDTPIKKGNLFTFTTNEKSVATAKAFIPCPNLHLLLKLGDKFLVDDGTIGFIVKEIEEKDIICKILNDGTLKSRKGLNFPNLDLSLDPISARDVQLIEFARKNRLNFVGVSFASNRKHIQQIEKMLSDPEIKVIAKIENQQGVANYAEIIDEAYGIMIDRGDLGSEAGIEIVPRLQKKIIKECNSLGKPIIIATQMLDSMVEKPYPTKAEISDVANAVLDGATALMLSAETAVGKFPLESVRLMSGVINSIEDHVQPSQITADSYTENFAEIVGKVISQMSQISKIDKIICLTGGGYSARMISSHKLKIPLIAATSNKRAYERLNILWGVERVLLDSTIDNTNSAKQKKEAVIKALERGLIDPQDTIVITGAVFPNHKKITNLIEIHKVSDLLSFFNQTGDLQRT